MRFLQPILLFPFLSSVVISTSNLYVPEQVVLDDSLTVGADAPRVNVTLYVMSRCPDARMCEDVFEDVLQYSGIQNKINFNLNFIAQSAFEIPVDVKLIVSQNKSEPSGFSCKHGQAECAGNVHDLCLQKHLALPDFYAALSCQNFDSPFPGKIGDVKVTRRCTEASKVDWWKSGVGQCIQGKKAEKDDGKRAAEKGKLGKEGRKLFKRSVKVTQESGVEKSCTIDIGQPGKKRCVVDGGVWTGCDEGHTASDFIRVIEQEWKDLQIKN